MFTNKIAVALAGLNNAESLAELERVAALVSVAEVRLDLMDLFDVQELIVKSPVPLVVTYRPTREGGRFNGPEADRLAVLKSAIDAGVAYIDIEADALDVIENWDVGATKIIASRHWFDSMPHDLVTRYRELGDRCDVVKLVGMASSLRDTIPVFELLRKADSPVITMAMGLAGRLTRMLSPAFASCLLTYGAASERDVTAPGQLSVASMVHEFRLDALGPKVELKFEVGDNWLAQWDDMKLTLEIPGDYDDGELRAVLHEAFPDSSIGP